MNLLLGSRNRSSHNIRKPARRTMILSDSALNT